MVVHMKKKSQNPPQCHQFVAFAKPQVLFFNNTSCYKTGHIAHE